MVEHERHVTSLMGLLSLLGGAYQTVFFTLTFLVYPYIDFKTRLKWIKHLYTYSVEENKEKTIHYDEMGIKTLYLKFKSIFRCFFDYNNLNQEARKIYNLIELGE